jgi:predicted ATPase
MLSRLAEREIAALIDNVTGNKPLPGNIRLDILERTDGIPLFVEEMTKAVGIKPYQEFLRRFDRTTGQTTSSGTAIEARHVTGYK